MKKALDLACEFIREQTGTCPFDLLDCEVDCNNRCVKVSEYMDESECWKIYFEQKEQEELAKTLKKAFIK